MEGYDESTKGKRKGEEIEKCHGYLKDA